MENCAYLRKNPGYAPGNMFRSEAGWMICRLSVLLCMVSNFAVSMRQRLYANVTDMASEIK